MLDAWNCVSASNFIKVFLRKSKLEILFDRAWVRISSFDFKFAFLWKYNPPSALNKFHGSFIEFLIPFSNINLEVH